MSRIRRNPYTLDYDAWKKNLRCSLWRLVMLLVVGEMFVIATVIFLLTR